MKIMQLLRVLIVAVALCGFLTACASKQPAMDDQSQVQTTDMGQQGDVAGVQDQAAGDQDRDRPSHQVVSELQRIHFEFDQFTLTPEAREVLNQNAAFLKANNGLQIVIEGHCDERGSDEYNLALGERRAMAAKNYLTSLGISDRRLAIISYGEEKPLKSGSNPTAWAANRRAEFKVVQ